MAHYAFFKGFALGAMLQNQFGKGASYGIADEKKFVYVLSVGPSALYRIHLGKFEIFAGVNYLVNQTDKQRKVASQSGSLGVTYGGGDSGFSTSSGSPGG